MAHAALACPVYLAASPVVLDYPAPQAVALRGEMKCRLVRSAETGHASEWPRTVTPSSGSRPDRWLVVPRRRHGLTPSAVAHHHLGPHPPGARLDIPGACCREGRACASTGRRLPGISNRGADPSRCQPAAVAPKLSPGCRRPTGRKPAHAVSAARKNWSTSGPAALVRWVVSREVSRRRRRRRRAARS